MLRHGTDLLVVSATDEQLALWAKKVCAELENSAQYDAPNAISELAVAFLTSERLPLEAKDMLHEAFTRFLVLQLAQRETLLNIRDVLIICSNKFSAPLNAVLGSVSSTCRNSIRQRIRQTHTRQNTSVAAEFALQDVAQHEGDLASRIGPLSSVLSLQSLAVLSHQSENAAKSLPNLLLLLDDPDKDIRQKSRDALLTCIRAFPDSANVSVAEDIWYTIARLRKHKETWQSTTSYVLWLNALCKPNILLPPNAMLQDSYWQWIRGGLWKGSVEQKKYCLAILRASQAALADVRLSTMVLQQSGREETTMDYAKFSVLFETIILGRYLNQVHAALPDLTSLSRTKSDFRKVWIIALLHAALLHGMQDSVRKIVGPWVLSHAGPLVVEDIDATKTFFFESFLPWATLGTSYVTTIVKTNGTLVSTHGEALARFISGVVVATRDVALVGTILDYIVQQDLRIFNFGRAFLLQGLLDGVQKTALELDRTCANHIAQIAMISGFHAIVGDYMFHLCEELIKSCGTNEERLMALRRDELVKKAGQPEEQAFETLSLAQLTNTLKETNQRFLWGTGLSAGIYHLQSILQTRNGLSQAPDTADADMSYILEALWEQLEVQEHPRSAIIPFVAALLNDVVLDLCVAGSQTLVTFRKLASKVQDLLGGRVYIFTHFAKTLRDAVVQHPCAQILPFADFVIKYAKDPVFSRVEFELERVISYKFASVQAGRTYESYYGYGEAHGHACVFDLINRLPQGDFWTAECRHILDTLLDPWAKQILPIPVYSRWKNSAQLQIMLLCIERTVGNMTDNDFDEILTKLFHMASIEPLPRFRYLLEWIIARMHMRKPAHQEKLLKLQDEMAVSNPKFAVTVIKVNAMLCRVPGADEARALECMVQLAALAASVKVVIRHEAQWAVPSLMDHAADKKWRSITDNPAFQRLDAHIRNMEAYKTVPAGRLLEALDPVADHTLMHLVGGSYIHIEPSEPARFTLQNLEDVARSDENAESQTTIMPLGSEPVAPAVAEEKLVSSSEQPQGQQPLSASVPLQTKASTWQADLARLVDYADPSSRRRAHEVIVVASFIDNAYNLGGLSRACEILGVGSLQVHSLRVLDNRDFTAVAVSSQLWLPIEQLETHRVASFLQEKRHEGYAIVGIEQTDSSRVLGEDDCQFPDKTVLVLGSERFGIPAEHLALLDFAVELKQVGVTRSMNVQTAAAVVLYEYSRQRSN